jgi:hypothetical protein
MSFLPLHFRKRPPPCVGDSHPGHFDRLATGIDALGRRGRQPLAYQAGHEIEVEAVRHQERIGAAVRARASISNRRRSSPVIGATAPRSGSAAPPALSSSAARPRRRSRSPCTPYAARSAAPSRHQASGRRRAPQHDGTASRSRRASASRWRACSPRLSGVRGGQRSGHQQAALRRGLIRRRTEGAGGFLGIERISKGRAIAGGGEGVLVIGGVRGVSGAP